jgi:conjugal transfer pilus assembly protein TraI
LRLPRSLVGVAPIRGACGIGQHAAKERRFGNLFRSRQYRESVQHVSMGLFDRRKAVSTPALGGAGDVSIDDTEIPRYPPFLKGLPVAAPERIVATQQELIVRLQDALAFTDERFTALVRPVVERYAAFVHLLPASEAHHHRGAGGLFRHGLEVAFHAAQASQGRIFALDRGPAERRELEPRWRLAAGLAGLSHDAGKPVSDLSVSDREGRTVWRPLLGSLTDWAADNGVERYFLRWRERRHARHETFGLLVLERILTPEVTSWLVDADPEIMQGLLSAVAGIDDGAVLGSLVTEADRASVERDLRENHADPAAASLGVPVDRYLLDAMRRLARGGKWQINVPGARLWMLAEGLHLVWPAGADDVVALLAADRVPGIPRDPDTLADILLERGLAVPRQEGDHAQRYWRLVPAPLARDGQVVTLSMLRLASPDLVLAGVRPAPVGVVPASKPTTLEATKPEPSKTKIGMKVIATASQDAVSAASPSSEEAPPSVPEPSELHETPVPASPDLEQLLPRPEVPLQPAGTPAGLETDSANQFGEAAARAATWLRGRGAGGEILLALAEVLNAHPSARDCRTRRNGEQLLVLFPDGLADLGAPPRETLEALAGDGLLDVNPLAPLRRVIEVDGEHGALLNLDASRRMLALLANPEPTPQAPTGQAPSQDIITNPAEKRSAEPSVSTSAPVAGRGRPSADTDPARALLERIQARDSDLPGGVTQTDGWLCVNREAVRAWAQKQGVQPYVLIRTLGHLPGCRVTPDGGLEVREEP